MEEFFHPQQMLMALTDASLLQTVLSHYAPWHMDNVGRCGFRWLSCPQSRGPGGQLGSPLQRVQVSHILERAEGLQAVLGSGCPGAVFSEAQSALRSL